MELVIYSILGVGVGFASGFFGIGGGMILVPLLMLMGFGVKYAIGISVMQMIFSSYFGSWINYKKNFLDLKNGFIVGIGGAIGASFSGLIVSVLPARVLAIILLCIVLLGIYKFFKTSVQAKKTPNENTMILFFIGISAGILGISVGLGGAFLITPILVGFLNFDLKRTAAISLFSIAFSSTAGVVSLAINGFVDYKIGLLVGIGSLVGVYFGTLSSHKVAKEIQKRAILILNIVIFFFILYKTIYMEG